MKTHNTKKNRIFLACMLLLSFLSLSSQEKEILGDSLFIRNMDNEFAKETGISDFMISRHDFDFRFENMGQILEIWKNKDTIGGVLINYIFRHGKEKKTIARREVLPQETATRVYGIITRSKIQSVPTTLMIEGWKFGYDGISYTIEQADHSNYSYKQYYRPEDQGSLPEGIIVTNLVNELSAALAFKDRYEAFKKTLPKKGCYHSGGMVTTCYIPNTYSAGYSGMYRMPYGYTAALYAGYIGNLLTDIGLGIVHRFCKDDSYDLSVEAIKSALFVRLPQWQHDYLYYNYRQRRLYYIGDGSQVFRNHTMRYGLALKPISVGLGADILHTGSTTNTGVHALLSGRLPRPGISASGSCSVFSGHVDYGFNVSKSIYFNRRENIVKSINFGLFIETFLNHTDAGLSVSFMVY